MGEDMKCPLTVYVFCRSDPFALPMQLYDEDPSLNVPVDDPSRAIEIDSSVQVACQINDKYGRMIAVLDFVPYADQVSDKGWFTLQRQDTSDWPLGEAVFDLKVMIDGAQRHSRKIKFEIEDVETP